MRFFSVLIRNQLSEKLHLLFNGTIILSGSELPQKKTVCDQKRRRYTLHRLDLCEACFLCYSVMTWHKMYNLYNFHWEGGAGGEELIK